MLALELMVREAEAFGVWRGPIPLSGDPNSACAEDPDVVFWRDRFIVGYAGGACTLNAIQGARFVDVPIVGSVVNSGIARSAVTGRPVIVRLSLIERPRETPVAVVTGADPMDRSRITYALGRLNQTNTWNEHAGSAPNTVRGSITEAALDCLGSRCTLLTVGTDGSNQYLRRHAFGDASWTLNWGAVTPDPIASRRPAVVQVADEGWSFAAQPGMNGGVRVTDPSGASALWLLRDELRQPFGVAALRTADGRPRVFASGDRSESSLVMWLGASIGMPSVNSTRVLDYFHPLDADTFSPRGTYLVAGVDGASAVRGETLRLIALQEREQRAIPRSALSLSSSSWTVIRNVRVAVARSLDHEGLAMIVYDEHGLLSGGSSVFGLLVHCTHDEECDDGDDSTCDRCVEISTPTGTREHNRCVHESIAVCPSEDAGVAVDAAEPSVDGASDASAQDAATSDVATSDASMEDARVEDAGEAIRSVRFTGGACACRVPRGAAPSSAWTSLLATLVTIAARGRRRRAV